MERGKFNKIIIRGFALVEILIGLSISLSFIIPSLIHSPGNQKSLYGFVVVTSLISVIIGAGLFRYKEWARKILIFFAGYVILTKFLLVSHLIYFSGNTIDYMPILTKDVLSFVYHIGILVVFNLRSIKNTLK